MFNEYHQLWNIIYFVLQIVIWFVIPAVKNSTAAHAIHTLSLIVLIQYIPRFIQLFPLNRQITKSTGVVAKDCLVRGSLQSHM